MKGESSPRGSCRTQYRLTSPKDGYSHIHPDSDQARTLTIREAARLQSFLDSYLFSGNMADCFRQIGNAVPPLLACSIAAQLLTQLGYEAKPPPVSG